MFWSLGTSEGSAHPASRDPLGSSARRWNVCETAHHRRAALGDVVRAVERRAHLEHVLTRLDFISAILRRIKKALTATPNELAQRDRPLVRCELAVRRT